MYILIWLISKYLRKQTERKVFHQLRAKTKNLKITILCLKIRWIYLHRSYRFFCKRLEIKSCYSFGTGRHSSFLSIHNGSIRPICDFYRLTHVGRAPDILLLCLKLSITYAWYCQTHVIYIEQYFLSQIWILTFCTNSLCKF